MILRVFFLLMYSCVNDRFLFVFGIDYGFFLSFYIKIVDEVIFWIREKYSLDILK